MVRFLLLLFCPILLHTCTPSLSSKKNNEIPIYVWTRGYNNPPIDQLKARFLNLQQKGIDGIIYAAGKNEDRYRAIAAFADSIDLDFQVLLPAMIQHKNARLASDLYMVNRLGQSAFFSPAYPRNHFLCPNKEPVYEYLADMYGKILDIPHVDGIQLDVIRFPDVILAPALWEKYGIVMDKEYPKYDYCYCEKCVTDFKKQSGIDIQSVEDPSSLQAWKQFRYDLITNLVNRLAALAHSKNKKISAAVFPGPHSQAMKLVRQEWHKWEVDEFFPMNYNDFYEEGPEWLGEICKEEVAATKGKIPIYSGLFICPDPANKTQEKDPEYFGLLPSELETAVTQSIQNGATGICLFTAGRMTEAHWKVMDTLESIVPSPQAH